VKLELSNFQPVAANEVIEQEVFDLGGVEQFSAPMIESDQELASLINEVGMTSVSDIDQLIAELEEAKGYLKAEEERVRGETARYAALTQAASASVKIIFDAVRDWRKPSQAVPTQSRASAFEITDAVEDPNAWTDAGASSHSDSAEPSVGRTYK
jgi:hypothetical protein